MTYKTNTVDGLGVCRWPRLIPSINLLINIITCCLKNIEPYVVIMQETWRIYSCQVVSTFAALIFTTGRVTTEWGMSPTLRDADDSGTHGLEDYTGVLKDYS